MHIDAVIVKGLVEGLIGLLLLDVHVAEFLWRRATAARRETIDTLVLYINLHPSSACNLLVHLVLICIEFEVIAILEILLQRQRYLGVINAIQCLRFAGLLGLLHKVPDLKGERRWLLAIGHLSAESSQAIVIVEYLVACAGCKRY